MSLHVDLSWILEVAERAGHRDPAPDDLGVPIAAVARHRAELLDAARLRTAPTPAPPL